MARDVDSNSGGAAVATKETASGAVALAGGRSRQQRWSINRRVGQQHGSIGDIDSYGGGGGGGGGGNGGAVQMGSNSGGLRGGGPR